MNLATYGKSSIGWYLSCGEINYHFTSKRLLKTYAIKHNITLYWRRDVDE